MNKELHNIIIDQAKQKTEENGVKFLFACLGGSKLRGLDNNVSDYDFYVFFQSSLPNSSKTLSPYSIGKTVFDNNTSKIDLQYHDIDYYIDYSHRWKASSINSLSSNPNDTPYRPNLFTSLTSDIIITDKTFLQNNFSCINESFNKTMLLDFFLSHNKFVFNSYLKKNVVRLRTYLYVIVDLLCFKWINDKLTMPNMSFGNLIEHYKDEFSSKERETLQAIFKSNKDSNTFFHLNLIKRNKMIENFLDREFTYQTKIMKTLIDTKFDNYIKFNVNSTYYSIIKKVDLCIDKE